METLNRNIGEEKSIQIKRVSEIITEKTLTLLGHCIRCPKTDPMNDPIFISKDKHQISHMYTKLVGHPRLRWVDETFKTAFEICKTRYTLDGSTQEEEIWITVDTEDGDVTYEPFFSTKEMNMKYQEFDKFNTNHIKLISKTADERKYPFERKPAKHKKIASMNRHNTQEAQQCH